MALFGKKKSPDPLASDDASVLKMEMVVRCNLCDSVSHNVVYMPEASMLGWICPNGHKNRINDFGLDF